MNKDQVKFYENTTEFESVYLTNVVLKIFKYYDQYFQTK